MTQNGQFVKRGVLTSRDMLESHFEPKQSEQPPAGTLPKGEAGRQGQPGAANIVIKPTLSPDELNETKYFNSLGVREGRQGYAFAYHQNVNNSNFVPPPPSRFLVGSHHSSSGPQPSQLPVFSGHPMPLPVQPPPPLPPGQPQQLFQSIRTTYVPHHIYNDIPIPVLNSETKYQEEGEGEMEEPDVRMLEEYEKLYQKYQEEREANVSLLRKVEFLEGELSKAELDSHDHHPLPPPAESVVRTKEVYLAKPTRIDTRQLAALLMAKIKPAMDATFERRKAACIGKLRGLLQEQETVIRTVVVRSTEEFIRH